jgi:hypothetical protein
MGTKIQEEIPGNKQTNKQAYPIFGLKHQVFLLLQWQACSSLARKTH